MSTSAWIMMLVTWAIVISFTARSFLLVLKSGSSTTSDADAPGSDSASGSR